MQFNYISEPMVLLEIINELIDVFSNYRYAMKQLAALSTMKYQKLSRPLIQYSLMELQQIKEKVLIEIKTPFEYCCFDYGCILCTQSKEIYSISKQKQVEVTTISGSDGGLKLKFKFMNKI